MIYFSDVVTSCMDYGFVSILVILKRILMIMQIVVPIVLIVSCIWGLIKLLINPEEKKGLVYLRSKFLAALIFFFIPFTVNLALSWTETSFHVSACWHDAEEYKAELDSMEQYDVKTSTKEKKKILHDISEYHFSSDGTKGTATGKSIVEYALKFVGKKYVWGGGHGTNQTLEQIYASGSGVDCSGFTRLVYKHFGYTISGTTSTQIHDGKAVSYSQAQAGDLILYPGHVAIFMGDGDKIVHASNSSPYPRGGVKITNNARYNRILSIRRII